MRKVLGVYSSPQPRWVGDGFPVRSIFSPSSHGQKVSPFLLLNYAGPTAFTPTEHSRGVEQHPHRGFETVTIVYQGELEHRDSTGNGGRIGPGDVQWMTAGSGILHEEFHFKEFSSKGGTLEMVQLWVNLPAKDKMAAPRYQTLLDIDIPSVDLSDGTGTMRVVAGDYQGHKGPAQTFTPINIWDLRLRQGKSTSLTLPDGHTVGLVVLHGTVLVNRNQVAREAQLVLLNRDRGDITLEANSDATVLILGGEPINEPVVAHGPFVMNTIGEIKRAMLDFESGKFGSLH